MNTLHEILAASDSLSNAERVALIAALWDRVAPEEWPVPSEDWQQEARRRNVEIDAGRMSTSAWQEARARARQRAGLND